MDLLAESSLVEGIRGLAFPEADANGTGYFLRFFAVFAWREGRAERMAWNRARWVIGFFRRQDAPARVAFSRSSRVVSCVMRITGNRGETSWMMGRASVPFKPGR
jgi:hypothetical protein